MTKTMATTAVEANSQDGSIKQEFTKTHTHGLIPTEIYEQPKTHKRVKSAYHHNKNR